MPLGALKAYSLFLMRSTCTLCLRERQAVSNDNVELHVALGNVLHQLVEMLVSESLAGLNDDTLVENLAQREVVERRGVHMPEIDTKLPRRTSATMPVNSWPSVWRVNWGWLPV